MKPQKQVWTGLGAVLFALANVVLCYVFGSGGPRIALSVVLAIAGIATLVSGVYRVPALDVDQVPVNALRPTPQERPWTLLEVARWIAMIAGAASALIGVTAFRVAMYEEEMFEPRGISALVTAIVGGTLFLRAYVAGTQLREMPDKSDAWDRVVAWIEDHGAVPAVLILTIATGVIFAGVFLGESIGDDLTFHMAESRRLADCIAAGDWDFWNPSANGGYASAYYYQVIPQLASALPTAVFGHHLFWFQLSLWLPLVAIPLAGYRGMRMMNATPWQALAAAFALAFVSGASRWGSGADGTFQVGLYTQTWALAAFPLGLGYGVRYLTQGEKLPQAIAWGAFVFLCHPFASIALCLGLAVGTAAYYLQFPVTSKRFKIIASGLLFLALAYVAYKFFFDRPQPLPDKPDAAVAAFKYFYIAPGVLIVGLMMRVGARGKLLAYLLIGALAIALLGNIIAFCVTDVVPKRPEGATEDLPPEWQLGNAVIYLGPILLLLGVIGRLVQRIVFELRDGEPEATEEAGPSVQVFWRLCIIGACLAVATLPGWITVIVDRDGFGGFPHRVWDEVGPGYKELSRWYSKGMLFDEHRVQILTWALPIVLAFGRMKFARWLWAPALTYAALLAIGPHAPKTADDLLPAVRFLGAMQVIVALGIGAGLYSIGRMVWMARANGFVGTLSRVLGGTRPYDETLYGIRTVVIAAACALAIFIGFMGSRVLSQRVNTLDAYDYHDEMFEMIDIIDKQPQGKKQVGPGCESHWWNLLSYVYGRRPALLQMGGGGLQASPNYDFVYSVRVFPKLAWVYDTPLFLYEKKSGGAPDGEVLGSTARYELRRLPAPGIVSPIQITGSLPEGESRAGSPVRVAAIKWLESDAPLSDHHLQYFGYDGNTDAPNAKVLRAFSVDPSPGDTADIYADVDAVTTSTFVARESWHPRWHAYVDGAEVPIRRVTPDFPAIDVPPGKHTIAFRFERPWWAHAAWLAWPGITLAAFAIRRRKKPRLPAARVVEP